MSQKIYVFDTTLRDGEQSPGVSLNINEKLQIAKQLAKLGVDIIEAGFPISSIGDFEAVRAVAQEVKGVTVAGLARANIKDIDRAWEAVRYAEQARIKSNEMFAQNYFSHISPVYGTPFDMLKNNGITARVMGAENIAKAQNVLRVHDLFMSSREHC